MSLPDNFYKKYIIKDEYMPVVYFFFWSSVAFAIVTFPFSFYSFTRCLCNESFKGSYIYRLFTLNGIANFFQYLAYMLTNQIGTLPNMNEYFTFLMDHKLGQLCQFLLLFSASAQSSFIMFISLNRLLSTVRSNQLKNHERVYFHATCLFAATISIVVSVPVFFANCLFVPITTSVGQTHYVAVVIEKKLTIIGFLYFVVGGLIANLLSAILVYKFVKIRRRQEINHSSSSVVSKVEKGLLVSVVSSSFLQLLFLLTQAISMYFQDFVVNAAGSLIIALYTSAPFWSLIIFVPSFRHCVLPQHRTPATPHRTNSFWATTA